MRRLVGVVGAGARLATFAASILVKQYRCVTLVRQPTGGTQRGISGGAFASLRLPGSGLEVDLPPVETFPVTPAPDAGVTPDVRVTNA